MPKRRKSIEVRVFFQIQSKSGSALKPSFNTNATTLSKIRMVPRAQASNIEKLKELVREHGNVQDHYHIQKMYIREKGARTDKHGIFICDNSFLKEAANACTSVLDLGVIFGRAVAHCCRHCRPAVAATCVEGRVVVCGNSC